MKVSLPVIHYGLTAENISAMTTVEIMAVWRAKNTEARDRGAAYYERLVDPITGKVVATITTTTTEDPS